MKLTLIKINKLKKLLNIKNESLEYYDDLDQKSIIFIFSNDFKIYEEWLY